MNTEELTQITAAHQSAISRHDQEMAEIRAILREGTAHHEQWQRNQEAAIARHEASITRSDTQIELINQSLAQFTAGLEELRILVANYIRGCENL